MPLKEEIDANYKKFFQSWSKEANGNFEHSKNKEGLLESYRRLAAFRSLRVNILEGHLLKDAKPFLLEANNDLVTAHVCAHLCAWRSALQFLRSAIENTLRALYYNDHPIELRQWEAGAHKMGFTALATYFQNHPDICDLSKNINGIEILQKEYATLSKAVHASSKLFRMTEGEEGLLLWKRSNEKLSAWSTREKRTIEGLSLLIIALFSEKLTGTKNSATRQVLAFAISASSATKIKVALKITI